MRGRIVSVALLAVTLLFGVAVATAEEALSYEQEVEAWAAERAARLRSPEGWLSLVGLAWLAAGENVVGSAPDAAVRLPDGAPPVVGRLRLEGSSVTFVPAPGANVSVDDQPVTGLRTLVSDAAGAPTVLAVGSLRLHVIERGGRFAVRTKDREAELLRRFAGIERFPIDPSWRLEASFAPHEDPRAATVPVPDVLGQVTESPSPGIVTFRRAGREHRLVALEGGDDGSLFLVFGDATNGDTTYGGGRFLYTEPPDGARVVVDFNRAYNPPCVFTPWATCPLPPPGNRLELAIAAGEKVWGEH
jgi:hypothetical protein